MLYNSHMSKTPKDHFGFLRGRTRRDGSISFLGNAPFLLSQKIQEGDPDRGWDGDIFLILFEDTRPNKGDWWVVDCHPGERAKAILKVTSDQLDERIIDRLRDMRNNARDLVGTVARAEAHDKAQDEAYQKRQAEMGEQLIKDMRVALKKDGY